MSAYTGSFAPQDMQGVSITVMRRSRSFSTPRAAAAAVVVQPSPISIGITLRPDRPSRRSSRSVMNAARAIYPVSSMTAISRYKIRICGRKPSTLPAPARMPSASSEDTHAGCPRSSQSVSARSWSTAPPTSPVRYAPGAPKARKNMKSRTASKIGKAVYRPVRIRSSAPVRSRLPPLRFS